MLVFTRFYFITFFFPIRLAGLNFKIEVSFLVVVVGNREVEEHQIKI